MRTKTSPLLLTLTLVLITQNSQAAVERIRTVPGEIVVKVRRPLDSSFSKATTPGIGDLPLAEIVDLSPDLRRDAGAGSGKAAFPRTEDRVYLLKGLPGASTEQLLAQARRTPGVLHAEPNYIGTPAYVPSDPAYAQTADHLARIGMEDAWDVQPGGSPSITVAIVDSGVDADHLDLVGAIHPSSYNFVDTNSEVFDDLGHGTRIAGIIAAQANNAEGIAGIAFGVQVLSLDVVDPSGVLTSARTISAINYAVAQGASVINLSLSFFAYSQLLQETCDAASQSAVLIASSGNENQGDTPVYPASFASVLGVGATRLGTDDRASFSNFNGNNQSLVDLVAPGVNIYTTVPGSGYDENFTSGTSYASTIVSGVAGLLYSRYPTQTPQGIVNHLLLTARPIAPWAGSGMVSAKNALENALRPTLTVAGVAIDDSTQYSSTNTPDNAWQAGETVGLVVTLENEGADASGIDGTLATTDSTVVLVTSTGSWPTVLAGAEREISVPFLVEASPGADAHAATFELSLTGDGGYAETLPFSVAIENTFTPPTIIATDTTWTSDKTYLIQQNTVVMDQATLTIEPGTVVKFADVPGRNNSLEIRGGIHAVGEPGREITFTSIDHKPSGGFDATQEIDFNELQLIYDGIAGDADNDGDNDILVALKAHQEVHLIENTGSYFEQPVFLAHATLDYGMDIGDADNDGDNDIVLSHDGLKLLRWSGHRFEPPVSLGAWTAEYRMVRIVDVDRDGDNDIIATGYMNNDRGFFGFLPWTGAGYESARNVFIDGSPFGLTMGDVDNDGQIEIVIGDGPSRDVFVYRWNGSNFDLEGRFVLGTTELAMGLAVADFDQDGLLELRVGKDLSRWNGSGFQFLDSIALTDFRAFRDKNPWISGRWDFKTFVADLNGDSMNDVVSIHSDEIHDAGRNYVSINVWDATAGVLPKYGKVNLRPNSMGGEFAHCKFEFAPVLDESTAGAFSDCVFERTGGEYSLSSTQSVGVAVFAGSDDETPAVSGTSHPLAQDAGGFTLSALDASYLDLIPGVVNLLPHEAVATIGNGDFTVSFDLDPESAPVFELTGPKSGFGKQAFGIYLEFQVSQFDIAYVPFGFWGDADGSNEPFGCLYLNDNETVCMSTGHDASGTAERVTCRKSGNSIVLEVSSGHDFDPAHGDNLNYLSTIPSSAVLTTIGFFATNAAGTVPSDAMQFDRVFISAANLPNMNQTSTPGSSSIVRCQAIGNGGGDGIRGGSKNLIDCSAVGNAGIGLQGNALIGCSAHQNGTAGMSGGSAESCFATSNEGTGISCSGNVKESVALENGDWGIHSNSAVSESFAGYNATGIYGASVSSCTSVGNAGTGIETSGVATGCHAEENEGVGIGGASFSNCVVVRNQTGLNNTGTSQQCYVAENLGDGVTGGTLQSSTVIAHPGNGVVGAQSVSNTWVVNNTLTGIKNTGSANHSTILENGGIGIEGRAGPSYTQITGTQVVGNTASGIKNAGPVTGCSLFDNGGESGYDFEETRPSTQLSEVDASGNYWGPETTAFMNANPWGTYANVPRIHDFVDNTRLALVRYQNQLTSPPENGPDAAAPAFLLAVTPNLNNAVNVDLVEFSLVFNENMATEIDPIVTFDTSFPFTEHVVDSLGWEVSTAASTTWKGRFAVGIETGVGVNTLRVAGAASADGFAIPDDTSHQFAIDTRAGLSGNRAVAQTVSYDTLRLEWVPSSAPDVTGYSVRRSLHEKGAYRFVETVPPSVTEYFDGGLAADTTYYYQIVEIDSSLNSRQLTNPFSGTTDPLGAPTRTPTPTSDQATATPTVTPTPAPPTVTPTPTPHVTNGYDVGPGGSPDGVVDARDLLAIVEDLASKGSASTTVFDFARYWYWRSGKR